MFKHIQRLEARQKRGLGNHGFLRVEIRAKVERNNLAWKFLHRWHALSKRNGWLISFSFLAQHSLKKTFEDFCFLPSESDWHGNGRASELARVHDSDSISYWTRVCGFFRVENNWPVVAWTYSSHSSKGKQLHAPSQRENLSNSKRKMGNQSSQSNAQSSWGFGKKACVPFPNGTHFRFPPPNKPFFRSSQQKFSKTFAFKSNPKLIDSSGLGFNRSSSSILTDFANNILVCSSSSSAWNNGTRHNGLSLFNNDIWSTLLPTQKASNKMDLHLRERGCANKPSQRTVTPWTWPKVRELKKAC